MINSELAPLEKMGIVINIQQPLAEAEIKKHRDQALALDKKRSYTAQVIIAAILTALGTILFIPSIHLLHVAGLCSLALIAFFISVKVVHPDLDEIQQLLRSLDLEKNSEHFQNLMKWSSSHEDIASYIEAIKKSGRKPIYAEYRYLKSLVLEREWFDSALVTPSIPGTLK